MWSRLLLVGVLLSFSADLQATSGGDGDEESQRPLNSFCQLPPDRSKCSDKSSIRIFYNSKAGVCETFVHRGCEGNGNNFATQLECLQACASRGPQRRCPKPPRIGSCVTLCRSDDDCREGYLCCPTGCGHACRRGIEEEH